MMAGSHRRVPSVTLLRFQTICYAGSSTRPMDVPREIDPTKIDWITVYQDEALRNSYAWDLIGFGIEQFMRASIIENLQLLIDQHAEGAKPPSAKYRSVVEQLMWNQLVDDVRIIVFFENCMKGILLFNGVIIHRFKLLADHERHKKLTRAQKGQPLGHESIALSSIVREEIDKNTLTMDLMLGEAYQKVIGIPPDVLEVVRRINDRRNNLHFHNAIKSEFSLKVLLGYNRMLMYVSEWADKRREASEAWDALMLQGHPNGGADT